MRFRGFQVLTLLTLCLLAPGTAAAQEGADPGSRAGPRFWQAAGGVMMTNWLTWAYNWYVQRWAWANVGLQSWGHNLRQGFAWDNDCFLDNQLAHPYHGSMYHHSARASGYGYWESFPFVAAGSAGWELFGENIRASLNDLINTTLGGMALGEVTYRLSALVGSGRGGRRGGLGRDLGAFAASPIATTYGLLDGRPRERAAGASLGGSPVGLAVGHQDRHPLVELAVQYGDPFGAEFARPYDAFDFRVRVSPGADTVVRHVGISGLLARHRLSGSGRSQLLLGVFQHYDYDDLPGIKASGHSVSAALLYQRSLGPSDRLNLAAHAEGLLLGGISSDHDFYWKRDFDLGPGAGTRLAASLARGDREWLRVDGRLLWLHSVHGSRADHLMTVVRVGATIPVGRLGVGGELALTTRQSRYREFGPVSRRVSQVTAFLTWSP